MNQKCGGVPNTTARGADLGLEESDGLGDVEDPLLVESKHLRGTRRRRRGTRSWEWLARDHLEAAEAAMQELGAEVAAGAMHGQHATIMRLLDRGTYWSGYWCETSA